jgi:hypothetical protein
MDSGVFQSVAVHAQWQPPGDLPEPSGPLEAPDLPPEHEPAEPIEEPSPQPVPEPPSGC